MANCLSLIYQPFPLFDERPNRYLTLPRAKRIGGLEEPTQSIVLLLRHYVIDATFVLARFRGTTETVVYVFAFKEIVIVII